MKNIFYIVLVGILCYSCVEMGKPTEKEDTKTIGKTPEKSIEHFQCPNGHKGSDKQGKCPECDTFYVHNQAYHGSSQVNFPPPVITDPNQANQPNTPAPAQNAFGAYHYICPNLHTGGSGSASNCPSCGTQLIHNQEYHK